MRSHFVKIIAAIAIIAAIPFFAADAHAKYVTTANDTFVMHIRKPKYTVTFNANSDEATGEMAAQEFSYGTEQALTANAFERNDYVFLGWNTKSDDSGTHYDNKESVLNLAHEDGANITLYAQWSQFAYYNSDEVTFTEMGDCINTGVTLYDEETIAKDFTITFDVHKPINGATGTTNNETPATIMNAMYESSAAGYPGMVFRMSGKRTDEYFFTGHSLRPTGITMRATNDIDHIEIRRQRGIVTVTINGEDKNFTGTSSKTHNTPVTFGCSTKEDGTPWRLFLGTVSNMTIRIMDSDAYTVTYNANGGTGSMADQHINLDIDQNLRANTFLRSGYVFTGWNTAPDGSGASYADGAKVRNLGENDEVVTLYAIWQESSKFRVSFDANGGTGSMSTQVVPIDGLTHALQQNTFTRSDGLVFAGWNTKADRTGRFYVDEQPIQELAAEGQEITLYATWAENVWSAAGAQSFTGSNNFDTGINLFSEENLSKDFEISFDIVNNNSSDNFATLVTNMDESGDPYPGFVFRVQNGQYQVTANVTRRDEAKKAFNIADTTQVTIKMLNKKLYVCTNNDENCGAEGTHVKDFSGATAFDAPLMIGSSKNTATGEPFRYFKGTLDNIRVAIYPSETNNGD